MTTQEIYTQLYKNHVTPDNLRLTEFHKGIMHANGCLYCTNEGITVIRIPADYPPELEGVTVSRTGEKTEGLECKHEHVLPRISLTEIIKDVDLKTLNSALKKIWRVSHKGKRTTFQSIIQVGDAHFSAKILKPVTDLLIALQGDIEIRQTTKTSGNYTWNYLIFADSAHNYDDKHTYVLVCGVQLAEGSLNPHFTVEEALAYVPEKIKPETKNWYEK